MMESTLISTPIGGGTSTIKKFYSVKTSQDSEVSNNNWTEESTVKQLDSLLKDLKNEREIPNDPILFDNNRNVHIVEYNANIRDVAPAYKEAKKTAKYMYSEKEHVLGSLQNVESNGYTQSNERCVNTMGYDPQHTISNDYNLSEKDSFYSITPKGKINTSSLEIKRSSNLKELENLKLSDDILPIPGTKVTTTVRTYTYEVPTEGVFKKDVSISDVHHNDSDVYLNNHIDQNKSTTIHCELNNSRNFIPQHEMNYSNSSEIFENNTKKGLLNRNIRTKDYIAEHQLVPTIRNNNVNSAKSYYYRNETITNNANNSTPNSIEYRVVGNSNLDSYPKTEEPNTMLTYKYSKITSSDNNGTAQVIQPFPVYDQPDQSDLNILQTPKNLNELLTNLDESEQYNHTLVNNYNPKHEIDTGIAKENGNDQMIIPSKNLAGPPVYYPPNHEMTLRREEHGAAYRAGGGWARARGEYEKDSGSKSKSSSKAGGAVVPVCLPLCCAMPCTIM